jgi:hypothetical protein
MTREHKFLTAYRHPEYLEDEMYWVQWRDCYNAGERYLRKYLQYFGNRETREDYKIRKSVSPIPAFARQAVDDIRNSVFQRLSDVARSDGSENYMKAANGEIGGVDNKGASMQTFLGIDALTEMLIMGRVGIYVDMPKLAGFTTMADEGNVRPYCYLYRVEDILSWSIARPEEPGHFTALLLRDRGIDYNQGFATGARLPQGGYTRYRHIWIDENDGKVRMRLFDDTDNVIDLNGKPIMTRDSFERNLGTEEGVIKLEIDRIPFTMPMIGSSVLKNAHKYQVALMNLASSDVSYALKANFPILTEQRDSRVGSGHLKRNVDDDGTTSTSDGSKPGEEIRTGISYGRTYDKNMDRPQFIHPSPEPLKASKDLQEKYEDDIRKLVNLAVQNKIGQRAMSAEAMKLSDQGLEAGLSYIGLTLQHTERQIAAFWAAYESKDVSRRKVATVKYPDRYSLKNDEDRIKEASELAKLLFTVPGEEAKKQLAKQIITTLYSGKLNTATILKIFGQIDEADYATSDPDIIIRAVEAGLVSEKTASIAIGFSETEYKQARLDHAERAKRIAAAQSKGNAEGEGTEDENLAARGLPDLDSDKKSGKRERQEAADTTLTANKKRPTRGQGKSLKKGNTK